jgi:hypothetical protein
MFIKGFLLIESSVNPKNMASVGNNGFIFFLEFESNKISSFEVLIFGELLPISEIEDTNTL